MSGSLGREDGRIVFGDNPEGRLYNDDAPRQVMPEVDGWTACPEGCDYQTPHANILIRHMVEVHGYVPPEPDDDQEEYLPDVPSEEAPQSSSMTRAVRYLLRRDSVTTAMDLAGIAAITAGFWLIRPFCGLICLGVCLILLSVAITMKARFSGGA